jgi:DNA-binding CsgD family transcriptional regulator
VGFAVTGRQQVPQEDVSRHDGEHRRGTRADHHGGPRDRPPGTRPALLAPAITRRLIEDFCYGPAPGTPVAGAAGGLSERELGVVRLIAQGLSNAEIAARLYLSEATVKSHIVRILAKLALRDRVQVAVYAYEHGIVRPGHNG